MQRKTILVIEDNELNMKLVRNLLELGDYHGLEAPNAESGLELARRHKPDLILMDIELPGMDGFTATQIIRKDPELSHIPVLALTAFAMQGDCEKASQAGCSGYITKPIDRRSFNKIIKEQLDREKGTSEPPPVCLIQSGTWATLLNRQDVSTSWMQ
jgi:CheY-like chemotaxis protein